MSFCNIKLYVILPKFFHSSSQIAPKSYLAVVFTLSWRRPLSYRNQSIDLLAKSMDWFLHDNGLRHERVKHSFLDKLNPICICGFDIETLNHFFLHCLRFANEIQDLCLRLKGSSPIFWEKPTQGLHQYFLMAIWVFQLNLTTTY